MTAESLVLEPDDALPSVPMAAAPWQLKGSGYVLAIRLPETLIEQHAFVPPSLAGRRHGNTAYVLLADFHASNCGAYQELLISPATFTFPEGHYCSITRIYVSSYASVVNGRRNWGLPKDHAEFSTERTAERAERVTLSRAGHVFAEFHLSHHGLAFPVNSGILPASMRTVMQHWRGQQYGVTLRAKGSLRMAKLLEWRFDPAFFPDLAQGHVLAAGYFPGFELTFPAPTQRALP
jgi:hypothetical protein